MHNIRSLKINELYEIVITNTTSNLYRYVTGEIIRIISYYNGAPKIEIICKDYELLLIDDKIITPYEMEQILMKDFKMLDFCYKKKDNTNEINIYIELDETEYDLIITNDNDNDNDKHKVKQNVKQYVMNVNIINHLYTSLKIKSEVRIVLSGTFNLLYENRYTIYVDPSLVQIPRILSNEKDIKIIRENILYLYK